MTARGMNWSENAWRDQMTHGPQWKRADEIHPPRVVRGDAPAEAEQPPRRAEGKYPVFEAMLRAGGLGWFETEHRFHPVRQWELDYAWVAQKVTVEIDGGAFIYGRHNRGEGFIEDMRKQREAVKLGWKLLRYPLSEMAEAVADLKLLLLV